MPAWSYASWFVLQISEDSGAYAETQTIKAILSQTLLYNGLLQL